MKKLRCITFYIISILLVSCASNTNKDIDTEHYSSTPIVEIQERLTMNLPEAFDKIALILSSYNLYIPDGLSEGGKFSTTSIRIKDLMCEAHFLDKAPVSCDFRIHGSLKTLNKKHTLLTFRYKQNCLEQRHIDNVCKDSNAERLLFSIHGDLRN
jgi:hypothetical protein